MEKLKNKHTNFLRGFKTFKQVIDRFNETKETVDIIQYKLNMGGVIKHFEITYELAWKFLKEYLTQYHGIELSSPRPVFQECYKLGILPEMVVNQLVGLAEDRNEAVHIYDEATAEEICGSILHHYEVLGKVLELIKIK